MSTSSSLGKMDIKLQLLPRTQLLGATAKDIEELVNSIIANVKKETTVTLEWEVKRVGIAK